MNSKKKWTIIAIVAGVVLAIIITCTVVVVGALNHNHDQQARIAQEVLGDSATSSTSTGDGGQGSEDDNYTNVPDTLVSKATGVVATIATHYSKTADVVTKPDAAVLHSAGMSKSAAASYTSPWDTVFTKAHTAVI